MPELEDEYKPYDITKLDEIVIFDGGGEVIELSREGKYINLIKESEIDKRYFRFDLQKKIFERINFYKTVDDKISETDVKNITYWFTDCKLITKDVHFGRLIVYAKNCFEFDRYSSPVRFVQQLGHPYIENLEQWEALGVRIDEIEEYFGELMVRKTWSGIIIDNRKNIFLDKHRYRHSRYISCSPTDCSKELLEYIKSLKHISISHLSRLYKSYNNGEFDVEKVLMKLNESDEFSDIFTYESDNYYESGTVNIFKSHSYTSDRIRDNIIRTIQEYSLDYIAFCRWIKKQKNVEKNEIDYLFDTNHYRDYLRCELELKDGYYSKMDKYPDNFRTEFHKTQVEFEAINGTLDEFKFRQQKDKFHDYEHTGVKYCMMIPEHPNEIKHEASELHHCVRSYIAPMTEGKTLIMFLRNKKEREQPLITVEVKNGVVKQAYGNHDSKPKKAHLEYLRHWANMKGLRMGCWK